MNTAKVIENNQSLEVAYKSIEKKTTGTTASGFYLTTSQCNFSVEKSVDSFNQFSDHTLSTIIRGPLKKTLKAVIKIYAEHINDFLNKPQSVYKHSYQHPNALFVAHGIEYFANAADLSVRATQNHLKKLEKHGFIIRENTYVQVKIFINPELLISYDQNKLKVDYIKLKLAKKFHQVEQEYSKRIDSDNQTLIQSKTTSWRTKYMTFTYNNLINDNVSNFNTAPKLSVAEVNSQGQDTPQSDNKKNENLRAAEKRAKFFNDTAELERIKKLKHQGEIQKKAVALWKIAYTNLYEPKIGKDYSFIAFSQEQYAVDYFKTQLSKTINHKGLNLQAELLHKRLKLWKSFVNNPKIKGFTPLPNTFFNPRNEKGFTITQFWIYKNEQNIKYNKVFKAITNKTRELTQLFTKNELSFSERITVIEKQTLWKEKFLHKVKTEQDNTQNAVKLTTEQFEFLNQYFIQKVNEVA